MDFGKENMFFNEETSGVEKKNLQVNESQYPLFR